LTGDGQAKVTEAAPGYAEEVRQLVFDPLTKAQSRQLREIGRRITRTIDHGAALGNRYARLIAQENRTPSALLTVPVSREVSVDHHEFPFPVSGGCCLAASPCLLARR
jgi:hypothetical protein